MKHIFTLLLVFIIAFSLKAQRVSDSLMVLDARIVSGDSLLPLHNAHIISKFNHWGTISNDEGRFKMLVNIEDSVLVTSIGFSPTVLKIDTSWLQSDEPIDILMHKDTILINEIIIHAFWDYRTFKQLIVNMEPIDLSVFQPDWEGTGLLYKEIHPLSFKGPIQALYDVFNKNAKLSRQLIRNRKEYNQLMIQMGRESDTIPPYPEHMIGR